MPIFFPPPQVLGAAACTVVSFDFSGSGMSEGDWVTLGYFEQHDVADVLAYLRSNGKEAPHARTRAPPAENSGKFSGSTALHCTAPPTRRGYLSCALHGIDY